MIYIYRTYGYQIIGNTERPDVNCPEMGMFFRSEANLTDISAGISAVEEKIT